MNNYLQTLLDSFGQALKEDETVKEYLAAREAYKNDVEITSAVSEYNVQRMLLEEQQLKEDADQNLIDSMTGRINTLFEKIMNAESMKALSAAEDKLNTLLTEVNNAIMSYVIPESGESCGGDCHHCHGCH